MVSCADNILNKCNTDQILRNKEQSKSLYSANLPEALICVFGIILLAVTIEVLYFMKN